MKGSRLTLPGIGDQTSSVRIVAAGGSVVDPELVALLAAQRTTAHALDSLSDRERDVARLMAEGRSNRGIAAALTDNLQTALESRAVIDQAKGILMERHKLTADQAFQTLAQASMRANRKLRDIADHLVVTGELPQR